MKSALVSLVHRVALNFTNGVWCGDISLVGDGFPRTEAGEHHSSVQAERLIRTSYWSLIMGPERCQANYHPKPC